MCKLRLIEFILFFESFNNVINYGQTLIFHINFTFPVDSFSRHQVNFPISYAVQKKPIEQGWLDLLVQKPLKFIQAKVTIFCCT